MFEQSTVIKTSSDGATLLAISDSHALLARRLVLVSFVGVALACASLAIDMSVAHAFLGKAGPIWTQLRHELKDFVRTSETFAHGWGALTLLLVILAVDVARRRAWLRMFCTVLCASVAALIAKLIIARIRPHYYFDAEAGRFPGGVLDTFQGWLPLQDQGYGAQSTPSGHATTAVALAIVLSHRWPHGRYVFLTLASMAILQRICGASHYLSDCFAGAALASLIAAVLYHPRLAGRWFDRFERRAAKSHSPHVVADPRQSRYAA